MAQGRLVPLRKGLAAEHDLRYWQSALRELRFLSYRQIDGAPAFRFRNRRNDVVRIRLAMDEDVPRIRAVTLGDR